MPADCRTTTNASELLNDRNVRRDELALGGGKKYQEIFPASLQTEAGVPHGSRISSPRVVTGVQFEPGPRPQHINGGQTSMKSDV